MNIDNTGFIVGTIIATISIIAILLLQATIISKDIKKKNICRKSVMGTIVDIIEKQPGELFPCIEFILDGKTHKFVHDIPMRKNEYKVGNLVHVRYNRNAPGDGEHILPNDYKELMNVSILFTIVSIIFLILSIVAIIDSMT